MQPVYKLYTTSPTYSTPPTYVLHASSVLPPPLAIIAAYPYIIHPESRFLRLWSLFTLSIVMLELLEMATNPKAKTDVSALRRGVMRAGHHHHHHLPAVCRAGQCQDV